MKVLMLGQDVSMTFPAGYPDNPWPNSFPGVADKLRQLVSELHVVLRAREGRGETWSKSNVFVYPTHPSGILRAPWAVYRRASGVLAKHPDMDVIVAGDPYLMGIAAWLLRRRFGKPTVVEIMAGHFKDASLVRPRLRGVVMEAIARFTIRRADVLRAYNEEIERKLIAAGIPGWRIFRLYAHYRLDLDVFRPGLDTGELRRSLGADGARVLLYVGRLAREKKVEGILDALPGVLASEPDVRLVVVGEGPRRRALERRAGRLGLGEAVRFTGRVTDALPLYYDMADALIVNSSYETGPDVIQEAMACGTPVVSTPVGRAPEWVRPGLTGYLVACGDAGGLAEVILRLLRTPELRKPGVSRACRSVIEKDVAGRGVADYVRMLERGVDAGRR